MKKRLLALLCVLALAMQPMASLAVENTGEENILISDNSEIIEEAEKEEESEEADVSEEEATEDEELSEVEEAEETEEEASEEIAAEEISADEDETSEFEETEEEASEEITEENNTEEQPKELEELKELDSEEKENEAEVYSATVDKTTLSYIIENLKNNSLKDVASVNETEIAKLLEELETLNKNAQATEEEIDAAVAKAVSMFSAIEYSESVNIVSGNAFKTQDVLNQYFGGMQVAENDAKYTYGTATPAKIKDADQAFKKLADGNLDEYIATESADTGDTEIIYNFGEDYYILGAELFSGFYYNVDKPQKRNRRNVGSYTVYVSNDGTNYTPVAKAVAKTEPDADETGILNYTISTKTSFAAVKAQYVKVVITKDEESVYYQLGEMVVKGFKIPPARVSLEAALKKCTGVDSALYVEKTYTAYKNAYDKAESLWFNTSSDEEEMKAAAKELLAAYNALEIATGKYILTGNLKSNDDLMYYPGYSNYFASKATYTCVGNSNWNVQDTDNRLLGGDVTGAYPKWTYGAWEDTSGEIIVDLHQTCYITGADLWTWEDTQCWIKKIEVSVSSDGVRWTVMGDSSIETSWENEPNFTNHRRVINFSKGIVGRYVKYEFSGGAYQHNPGEIVVMGTPGTPETEEIPSPVGNVDYVDDSGNYLYTLEGATDVTANGSVSNNSKETMNVRIITVVYNEYGELVDSVWTTATIDVGSGATYANALTGLAPMKANYTVETFVWAEGANGEWIPVSQTKSFGTLK